MSEDHSRLIMSVSRSVGHRYAATYPALEAEDIAAEVAAQAVAQWQTYRTQLDRAPEHGKSEYEVLHFLLSQRASEYCGREHYEYMINTASAVYTPREVRALLKEVYYNPDAYTVPARDTDHGVAVEVGSLWANLSDLKSALSRVSDRTHDVILSAFGPEDAGLPVPDKRRVSDAVAAVTRELNRHLNTPRDNHEGPGARLVTRNQDGVTA